MRREHVGWLVQGLQPGPTGDRQVEERCLSPVDHSGVEVLCRFRLKGPPAYDRAGPDQLLWYGAGPSSTPPSPSRSAPFTLPSEPIASTCFGDRRPAEPPVRRLELPQDLARICEVLPLSCPSCGAQIRIPSFLADPPVVRSIFLRLDLLPHIACRESPIPGLQIPLVSRRESGNAMRSAALGS